MYELFISSIFKNYFKIKKKTKILVQNEQRANKKRSLCCLRIKIIIIFVFIKINPERTKEAKSALFVVLGELLLMQ